MILHYEPFKIPFGIDYRNCHGKLTTDSSFNNTADRKSQNCHHLLLCAGPGLSAQGVLEFTKGFIMSSKSGKSKRVCTSTMHAEALAMIGGTEDAEYFLSWLLELQRPNLSARQLADIPLDARPPLFAFTDCNDLHQVLINAATPMPTNKQLVLYIAALREDNRLGLVTAYCWCDTVDQLANTGTKLSRDGLLDLDVYDKYQSNQSWFPLKQWMYGKTTLQPPRVNNAARSTKCVYYTVYDSDDDVADYYDIADDDDDDAPAGYGINLEQLD